jgi:hypothetical protein
MTPQDILVREFLFRQKVFYFHRHQNHLLLL